MALIFIDQCAFFNPNANGKTCKECFFSGDIKVECASPEMPVTSESSTWNPVEETEENNDTAYIDFLPEAPQPPPAPAETELTQHAAGQGSYAGMFNLIIRK